MHHPPVFLDRRSPMAPCPAVLRCAAAAACGKWCRRAACRHSAESGLAAGAAWWQVGEYRLGDRHDVPWHDMSFRQKAWRGNLPGLPALRQAFFHAELSAFGNARDVGDAFALAARSFGKAGVWRGEVLCWSWLRNLGEQTRQSWQTGVASSDFFWKKHTMFAKKYA